jgi:flagellin-like protein
MWIMGKHFNNRAVSAVIATLLLIAIAVAAAIIVYVFSIGLLGGLQTSGGQQVKQQVIMEAYCWPATGSGSTCTANDLTLTLRNVGPAAVQFSDYFINGQAVIPTGSSGTNGLAVCSYGTTVVTPLAVGSACGVQLPGPIGSTTGSTNSYSAGVAYVIKVVSVDGGVFSYSAIAGQSS